MRVGACSGKCPPRSKQGEKIKVESVRKKDLRVAVIGGGAAGFFGAIATAETHPNVRVILLEAGRQPLEKVRISGGGRCNVIPSWLT